MEAGHPLPAQPEHVAVLAAGRHLELRDAVQDRHVHLGPERRLGEGQRERAVELVALAREEGVLAHVEDDVEIARRAAGQAPFALAGDAHLRALVDAGRDAHLERPLLGHAALARAGLARALDDLALAAALGAGAGDREEALLVAQLAAPLAGGALGPPDPGSAPLPWQVSQTSSRGICSRVSSPCAASSSVISRS